MHVASTTNHLISVTEDSQESNSIVKQLKFLSGKLQTKNSNRVVKKLRDNTKLRTQVLFTTTKESAAKGSKTKRTLCDDESVRAKRILSYSMYGEKGRKLSRFIPNILEESQRIHTYQNFTIRIYTDFNDIEDYRTKYIAYGERIQFCDVRAIPEFADLLSANVQGMLWRFMSMVDPHCEVMCSRDLDSPLLQREGDAVDEWMKSNTLLHVMRDKRYHNVPIMGGMWCFRSQLDARLSHKVMKSIVTKSNQIRHSGGMIPRAFDQKLLEDELWSFAKHSVVQHDSFYCQFFTGSIPFPTKRRNYYVGCVRNCSEKDVEECPVACRPKNHKDWMFC